MEEALTLPCLFSLPLQRCRMLLSPPPVSGMDDVTFQLAARVWLADVGLDIGRGDKEAGEGGGRPKQARQAKTDIGKFLNRLLGLQLNRQGALFSFFTQVPPLETHTASAWDCEVKKSQSDPPPDLSPCLCLQMLEATIRQAKRDGDFDDGILEMRGRRVQFVGEPAVLCLDPSSNRPTLLFTAQVDRGVSWDRTQQLLQEAAEQQQQQANDG